MSFLSLLITASVGIGSMDSTTEGQVRRICEPGPLLIGMTMLEKHSFFAKAENTHENGGGCGGGGGAVLGLFSRVINKVCGKQRGRRRAFDLLEMAGVFPGEA